MQPKHFLYLTTVVSSFLVQGLLFMPEVQAQAAPPCQGFGAFEVDIPGISTKGVCISKFITDSNGHPLVSFVGALINVMTAIVILVGLMAIIFGAYLYMTAGGDSTQIGNAKTFIKTALLAIVLALTAYIILNTISSQFIPKQDPNLNL